jgi:ribonuclease HI
VKKIMLFTDGSVDVKTKIGFGAYLIVHNLEKSLDSLKNLVKVQRFENTSSTKLELQILLWALQTIDAENCKVKVYTDSQNIIGLPERHERFEKNDYHNKKGKLIKNHQLYKDFFLQTNPIDIEFIKVRGHSKIAQKDNIDKIFTTVDRASRRALRNIKQLK